MADEKKQCWEYLACFHKKECPAYPDHGRHCARVAGTMCGGKVQGTFAAKLKSCMECPFYQSENYDKSYTK